MKKLALIVIILSLIFGVLFWKFSPQIFNQAEEQKQANLTYWGVFEDEAILRPIILAYQSSHPHIKITYVKQSLLNYRTRLQTQIAAGQGPDVFEIHSSFLPMLVNDLTPAPFSVMGDAEFANTFYSSIKDNLVLDGKVYALPLEVNGLVLFYNEDILKAAGIGVPENWQDFIKAAKAVTVRNQEGQIQTSGASLGTASNIDFWPEILGMLFLEQPEGNLKNPANKDGVEVLQFYTSFVTDPRNKTWDTTLPSSTQMFTSGKLAFYFAPISQVNVIKSLNPNLPFKVAPVPQLPGGRVSYGSYWAGGVSKSSTYQKEAWEFLKFLTSSEVQQVIYQQHLQSQTPARISARMDLSSQLSSDPILQTFITQAPYYKSWYLNSQIQDAGINDEMIKLYGKAVNAVLGGESPTEAVRGLETGVKQVLEKYKVDG